MRYTKFGFHLYIRVLPYMEHLRIPPEKMYRRFKKGPRYPFAFADILRPHLNVDPYIGYLSSLDEYCLKNIWNHVAKSWRKVRHSLSDDKAFRKSKYGKLEIFTHRRLTTEELDECFKDFIGSDKFLALFVINAIQDYLYPV